MSSTERKPVVLHVGIGKTGTSLLQSALALGSDILAKSGFFYPAHRSEPFARQGKISSGNLGGIDAWHDKVREEAALTDATCVFSNENLYRKIVAAPEHLSQLARDFDLTIIMFLRDPVEHAPSAYVQDIKRAGFVGTFSEHLAKNEIFDVALRFAELCRTLEIDFKVYNYSRHKADLLSLFSQAIGLPEGVLLPEPPRKVVNRSLTQSEIELQKIVNATQWKRPAWALADRLCNDLHEVPAKPYHLSDDEHASLVDKVSEPVALLNTFLSEGERMTIAPTAEATQEGEDLYFSKAQLKLIVQWMARNGGMVK